MCGTGVPDKPVDAVGPGRHHRPVITTRGLGKTYPTRTGPVEAVRAVDLEVGDGEIVGFLGPNGAGKTTTQRMLTTLIPPSRGSATVAGHDLAGDPVAVRRSIGYVAQGGCTEPAARVGEELVDQGRLYGMGARDAERHGHELLAGLDLDGLWERQTKTLSGGQRRRLDIALGLIHSPGLVFLDEPSTGLDPQSRANLWGHIRGLRDDRGASVFLTTHYLDEADALCDRVLVIDHGEIVASGTPDELKRQVSGDTVLLTAAPESDPEPLRAAAAASTGVPTDIGADGVVRFVAPGAAALLPHLLRALDDAGIAIAALEVRAASLDDVFLSVTGRSLRDSATEGSQTIEAEPPKENP